MSKYKKNKAVALKYNVEEDASPVVIASGYGTVAEHIIDIAEKKGIPVFKDDSAASLLCMLEVGSNIPVELYEVVAAIYCKLIETSAQMKELNATRTRGSDSTRTKGSGSAMDGPPRRENENELPGADGTAGESRVRLNLASGRKRRPKNGEER